MTEGSALLLVDDEAYFAIVFQQELLDNGYQVMVAPDAETALRYLADNSFRLVISDWYLPGMQGDELITEIQLRYPATMTLLMSSHAHVNEAAHRCHAHAWFRKYDGLDRFRTVVAAALHRQMVSWVPA